MAFEFVRVDEGEVIRPFVNFRVRGSRKQYSYLSLFSIFCFSFLVRIEKKSIGTLFSRTNTLLHPYLFSKDDSSA